jgi:hypothetical protein
MTGACPSGESGLHGLDSPEWVWKGGGDGLGGPFLHRLVDMVAVHFDTRRGYHCLRIVAMSGLLMAAAVFGVTGCGGSGQPAATAGTTLASQAAPQPSAQQGGTTAAKTIAQGGGRTGTAAATTAPPTKRGAQGGVGTTSTGTTGGAGSATTAARTSGHKPAAGHATPTTATSTHKPGHPAAPPVTTATTTTPNWVNTTGNSQTTTIPATAASPTYVGPSPIGCLESAGLNRARPGSEPYVWEANSGLTSEDDHLATVFLSGPYQDATTAADYAQSLKVVEVSATGGRWVASAALHSGLDDAVNQAAACMAAG